MRKSAIISDDGCYRYRLDRIWDGLNPLCVWVMLNPSTADAEQDDPTIRKCIGFTKRWGYYGGIRVVNIMAFRATNPKNCLAAEDPIGPDNERYLRATETAIMVVCAWGARAPASVVTTAMGHLGSGRLRLHCLGKTKAGHPRHPLYVPYNRDLEEYAP
jgi:hypothetical protein